MQKCFINVDGIQLYTESFGDASNPAVLLIAGAMAPARFWTDEFCQLLIDAGCFVIRYDHRDMGLSSAVDYVQHPYSLNDLTKDAIAILDAYNIEKAHIIGHSMGGAIAQLLALDYPARVASLTLVSSAVLTNASLDEREQNRLNAMWKTLEDCNKPTKKFDESVNGFLKSYEYLHGDIPVDRDIATAYIKDMYERSKPEHIAWFEKYSSGIEPLHNHVKAQQNIINRTQDLKKISVPVVIIHGEKDCLSFPRIVQEYCAQLIPHAQMRIISGMGHMILSRALFNNIQKLWIEFCHES
jgi:pimeloyl-ACP methyl ester carboxylesterase